MKKMLRIFVLTLCLCSTSSVFAFDIQSDVGGYNGIELVRLYDMSDYQFAYIGNIRTMKLHVPGCRYAAKTSYQNLIGFGSRSSAIRLGFTPCGFCKP